MKQSKNRLLVEGLSDKSFYEEFCRSHQLETRVEVANPRDVGGTYNSKRGAIEHLPLLLSQLADASLERLGLVVDADHVADGGGFDKTIEQIVSVVSKFGYGAVPIVLDTGGLLFRHADGLHDFGLWVMPDNGAEGALEHWIMGAVCQEESALLAKAQDAVVDLGANAKFVPHKKPKAEVATWLAWQKKPGEGLYFAVKENLLNQTSPGYQGLLKWMEQVFS